MEREKLISYCKYYKGEEKCPYEDSYEKMAFWHGEKMWVETDQIGYWTDYGREVKATLTGEKLERANQYTDLQFGIVCLIEALVSKFNPYNDLRWLKNY